MYTLKMVSHETGKKWIDSIVVLGSVELRVYFLCFSIKFSLGGLEVPLKCSGLGFKNSHQKNLFYNHFR